MKGKENGFARLRESKPFSSPKSYNEACANYVWRMLCFDLVGSGKHVCMPVCADFNISDAITFRDGKAPRYVLDGDNTEWQARREQEKELRVVLDALVDRVEQHVPVMQRKGILRWGKALGTL